jgi:hypothetical protein
MEYDNLPEIVKKRIDDFMEIDILELTKMLETVNKENKILPIGDLLALNYINNLMQQNENNDILNNLKFN